MQECRCEKLEYAGVCAPWLLQQDTIGDNMKIVDLKDVEYEEWMKIVRRVRSNDG